VTDLRSSDDEDMKGLPISKLVVRHEQEIFEISSQGDEVLSIFQAPTSSSSSSSSFKGFIQSSSVEQVRASYCVEGVGGKIPTMSAKRQREEKKGELPVSSKVSKTAITSLQRCSPPLADSFTISSHPLSGKQSSVPVSSSFPISKVSSSASFKVSLGGRSTSAAFARPPLPAISFVPSVISTTSFYGVPVNNKSVLLYPLPWAPKGWTMVLPTRLSLEKNLSQFEKQRSIGNGIGGNLLLGFPRAPCTTGDSTDLANVNLANELISFYRKYHELCCIHILLDRACPKCEDPPSAVSPPGRLTSSLMKKGAPESMLFLGRLFDSKNTRAGTKGKGMGTAASHNEDASVSLQRIREVSGNPHLIVSGDVLGATGGMRHLMNLQHELWIKYEGKDIPVGDMNEMAAAYDRKHGTKTKKMAHVVQVLLNDMVSNGEAVDRVQAAAQYDIVHDTKFTLSASIVIARAVALARESNISLREAVQSVAPGTNMTSNASIVMSFAAALARESNISLREAVQSVAPGTNMTSNASVVISFAVALARESNISLREAVQSVAPGTNMTSNASVVMSFAAALARESNISLREAVQSVAPGTNMTSSASVVISFAVALARESNISLREAVQSVAPGTNMTSSASVVISFAAALARESNISLREAVQSVAPGTNMTSNASVVISFAVALARESNISLREAVQSVAPGTNMTSNASVVMSFAAALARESNISLREAVQSVAPGTNMTSSASVVISFAVALARESNISLREAVQSVAPGTNMTSSASVVISFAAALARESNISLREAVQSVAPGTNMTSNASVVMSFAVALARESNISLREAVQSVAPGTNMTSSASVVMSFASALAQESNIAFEEAVLIVAPGTNINASVKSSIRGQEIRDDMSEKYKVLIEWTDKSTLKIIQKIFSINGAVTFLKSIEQKKKSEATQLLVRLEENMDNGKQTSFDIDGHVVSLVSLDFTLPIVATSSSSSSLTLPRALPDVLPLLNTPINLDSPLGFGIDGLKSTNGANGKLTDRTRRLLRQFQGLCRQHRMKEEHSQDVMYMYWGKVSRKPIMTTSWSRVESFLKIEEARVDSVKRSLGTSDVAVTNEGMLVVMKSSPGEVLIEL
jgi:cell division inhibitor SulA